MPSNNYEPLGSEQRSFYSYITYSWIFPLLKSIEATRNVTLAEVEGAFPKECKCSVNGELLKKEWGTSEDSSIFKALYKIYFREFLFNGFVYTYVLFSFSGPMLLKLLVECADKEVLDWNRIIMLIVILFVSKVVLSFAATYFNYVNGRLTLAVTAGIKTLIYQKILRLSTDSRVKFSAGNITNVYTVDIERVVGALVALHNFWALPLQIILSMVLLFDVVSYAMFGGFAAIISILAVNDVVAKQIKKSNDLIMKCKDKRMKASSEAFNSILTIKLNCWEDLFMKRILACRSEELVHLWTYLFTAAVSICLLWTSPAIVSVVTIIIYTEAMHQDISAAKIFTALALFRMLQDPLRTLPQFLAQVYQAQSSLERLQSFYSLKEKRDSSRDSLTFAELKQGEVALRNVSFFWSEADAKKAAAAASGSVGFVGKSKDKTQRNSPDSVVQSSDGWKQIISFAPEGEDEEDEESAAGSGSQQSAAKKSGGGIVAMIQQMLLGRTAKEGQYKAVSIDDSSSHGGSQKGGALDKAIGDSERSEADSDDEHDTTGSGVPVVSVPALHIKVGQLVVLKGSIGSGKSSLCSAILGEMYSSSGVTSEDKEVVLNALHTSDVSTSGFTIKGSVAYVSQQPWIQNMTIRDNILFGSAFNAEKYAKVIDACCLVQDLLELAPLGDATVIGEKGINLSGGQKARIALARAVYADRDVYIIDDVLAALDAIVSCKVWNRCILGLLGGKTRILSSHSEDAWSSSEVDVGVLMEANGGRMVILNRREAEEEEELKVKRLNSIESVEYTIVDDASPLKIDGKTSSSTQLEVVVSPNEGAASDAAKEAAKEESGRGNFKADVYLGYFRSMGGVHILVWLLFVQTVWQLLLVGSDLYLSYWSKESDATQKADLTYNLVMYSLLSLGSGGMVFVRSMTVSTSGYAAAKTMHEQMVRGLMYAPMAWHDLNPSGRILNRLSDDMSKIDNQMPFVIGSVFTNLFALFANLLSIIFITRFLIIGIVPLTVAYMYLLLKYLRSSREIQRVLSSSLSPVLSMMSESVSGVAIIRAFGAETTSQFVLRNEDLIDANNTFAYIVLAASSWIFLRIQLLSSVCLLLTCVFAFLGLHSFMSPGLLGMTISITLDLNARLVNSITILAGFENGFVAPERVLQYMSIEPEGTDKQKRLYQKSFPEAESSSNTIKDDNSLDGIEMTDTSSTLSKLSGAVANKAVYDPPPQWPRSGSITFKNVSFKYQPHLPPVLKHLSLSINSGEKIGIVGRTGSGKSSLSMCLFRIAELCQGCIEIDGVDVSTLPLKALRDAIQIIPQSPVLFKGTVRGYLDPQNAFTDDEIWSVIAKAQIRDTINNMKRIVTSDGKESESGSVLDRAEIEENGGNLSVGERQMLVLSKALLWKTKILVMDEATASVDTETDRKVQLILRQEFKHSTVLTIAHRIETIRDYDRILVMHNGEAVEFDTPSRLLQNRDSLFSRLAEDQQEF